jgi:hypothetical protein
MHRPPVVASLHGESQQTPSVQKPLLHCVLAVQANPFRLSPHELLTQVLGDTQSLSLTQVARQLLLRQVKVPQDTVAGVTQAPLPSQVDAGIWYETPVQLAGLQVVPLAT